MARNRRRVPEDLVPNGSLAVGRPGDLPQGWSANGPRASLMPSFKLAKKDGERVLLAAGNGAEDCIGYVAAPVSVRGGHTYRMRVRFKISRGLDPQKNLLFCCYAGHKDGIFHFRRLTGGWVEGDERIVIPGQGEVTGDVRIFFRFSATGKAWIRQISLVECEPIAPRLVRVACTGGFGVNGLSDWRKVLAEAGREKVDLILLPEFFSAESYQSVHTETMNGPSAKLMSEMARRYRMYVAGGVRVFDSRKDRIYNKVLLFDRRGKLVGEYAKNHPYTPEILEEGVTPGTEVPVFRTDFGTIGFMICYDSWFPDVAELAALKGAEILCFPHGGYYRSLMPARAADNGVRIMASGLMMAGLGIWDTVGRDILNPDADPTTYYPFGHDTFRDVAVRQVGVQRLLVATLDLSRSPSPAHNGGTMMSAPGGRRNRLEQIRLLYGEIQREVERWWDEPEGDHELRGKVC